MAIRPWLENLRGRLYRTSRRASLKGQDRSVTIRQVESYEDRSMLTATLLFLAGDLQVLTDANENVTVRQDPGNANRAQVLINGTVSPALPGLQVTDVTSLTISTGDSENIIDVSGVRSAVFTNLITITINSFDGDDAITGSDDFGEIIDAGDGNDIVVPGGGNDIVDGNDGNDSISGGLGNDLITGGDGNDNLVGDEGDDIISAGDGVDTVNGLDGNDSIDGGQGIDIIHGNNGVDSIIGGLGNDQVFGDAGDDTLFGGGGNDLMSGGDNNDSIFGNGGNDVITGDAGDDLVRGGTGNDTINGNEGNDNISGDENDDSLLGDDGNDFVFGGSGNDDAEGGFGDDFIRGNAGNDTLCGTFGSDNIDGNTGNDLIEAVCVELTPIGISIGDVNVQEGGTADVVFVIDISGSTFGFFGGSSVGDINGDGFADTILDAELASALAFQQDLISRNVQANLSIVAFDTTSTIFDMDPSAAGLQRTTTPTADTNANGVTDFEEVVRSLQSQGGTAFEPPLQDAITVFQALGTQPGNGTLIFLSDGSPFDQGAYDDEVQTLQGLGVTSRAFAVGVGAFLPALQIIDPNTIQVLTTTALITALGNLGVTSAASNIDLILSSPPPVAFTVDITVVAGTASLGTDFIVTSTQLTFAAGQTTARIPVQVTSDTNVEGPETFSVTLSNIQTLSQTITPFQLVDPTATITIYDRGATVPASPPLVPPAPGATIAKNIDPNPDTLFGSDGNDTIIGDLSDDLINGGNGDDFTTGGDGNDQTYGGAGNDTLDGEGGRDTIVGNGGNDRIVGGDGDDTLVWNGLGQGNDTLDGGTGSDGIQIVGSSAGNNFVVGQTFEGLLTVTDGAQFITSVDAVPEITVSGGGGDDTITVGNLSKLSIGLLTVNGDLGNDFIDATNATYGKLTVRINGGDGDDTLSGSNSAEVINGDAGIDIITARSGNDTVDGGAGADNINGGDGNDSLAGGSENDIINGGLGNDSIDGGLDNDSLLGGDGNDTVLGSFGNDTLAGEVGNDSLSGGIGTDSITGGSGNDTVDGGRNDDSLFGDEGNDRIVGDHGNDFIGGGTGDDTILGGDGNDTISGGSGRDLISGGDGNDFIRGDNDKDTITGGDGNDTLVGGIDADVLLGEQGDDLLDGQGGTDLAAKGGGADTTFNIEVLDETYRLSDALLAALNG